MRRACSEPGCLSYGENTTRCPAHTKRRDSAKSYRRANAPGDGAARRARAALTKAMTMVLCRSCRRYYYPHEVQVDHVVALADGGFDVDTNLQVLCTRCHREKTTRENAERSRRR